MNGDGKRDEDGAEFDGAVEADAEGGIESEAWGVGNSDGATSSGATSEYFDVDFPDIAEVDGRGEDEAEGGLSGGIEVETSDEAEGGIEV